MARQNERGPIAETYEALQGLSALEKARAQELPPASGATRVRCLLQAVEVALHNLADLLVRAGTDVAAGAIGPAAVKLRWSLGFHRVLSWLSQLPHRLLLPAEAGAATVRLIDSPAKADFFRALLRLDKLLKAAFAGDRERLAAAVANESLDSNLALLLHLTLECDRETVVWEQNLAELPVPVPVVSYATFIGAEWVRVAVEDMRLQGDTFMMQFRGLHQIPELLAAEACDLMEAAVRGIRDGALSAAVEALEAAGTLFEGALPCMTAMADNLCAADYHRIRENLGLTSGSHSANLHHHLFHDLYNALAEAALQHLAAAAGEEDLEGAARWAAGRRHGSDKAWLTYHLLCQCLAVRGRIAYWRELHLNLPRTNLGGLATRSLIGSVDAVSAVRRMRESALQNDALAAVVRAYRLPDGLVRDYRTPAALYFESGTSWDEFLEQVVGDVTQGRFPQVQERVGVFAGRCPFTPPPPRTVD
jgi:tryptophan 2,3-dioxygenase